MILARQCLSAARVNLVHRGLSVYTAGRPSALGGALTRCWRVCRSGDDIGLPFSWLL